MQDSVMSGDAGLRRRNRHRIGLVLALSVLLVGAACSSDDDDKAAQEKTEPTTAQLATELGGGKAMTEDKLPPGFEPAPMVTIDGQQFKMDMVPGHYWKPLDNGSNRRASVPHRRQGHHETVNMFGTITVVP